METVRDRRNYARRVAAVQAVVTWLRVRRDDMTLLAAVPPQAAERILKQLAARGLAMTPADGVWRPAPALLYPAELIPEPAHV